MRPKSPPESDEELVTRARAIAGLRLSHLAQKVEAEVPETLARDKGWIGRLLEATLGADATNASAADFTALGIELKTIPVDRQGRPRETTFVCSVPLAHPDEVTWQTSSARKKLARILWVPILCDDHLSIADRMVGTPLLWSPDPQQEQLLAADWRDHLDVIRRGYVDDITARDGQILQIRPKGANADSRTWSIGSEGQSILTNPRAFYLRTGFTRSILARHLAL